MLFRDSHPVVAPTNELLKRVNGYSYRSTAARQRALHRRGVNSASATRYDRQVLLGTEAAELGGVVKALLVNVTRANDRDRRYSKGALWARTKENRGGVATQALLKKGRIGVVGTSQDPDSQRRDPLDFKRELTSAREQTGQAISKIGFETNLVSKVGAIHTEQVPGT